MCIQYLIIYINTPLRSMFGGMFLFHLFVTDHQKKNGAQFPATKDELRGRPNFCPNPSCPIGDLGHRWVAMGHQSTVEIRMFYPGPKGEKTNTWYRKNWILMSGFERSQEDLEGTYLKLHDKGG